MYNNYNDLVAPRGKFRILCIDKFEIPGEGHYVYGDYDSLEEALDIAKEQTKIASKYSTHEDIATVYYVYDENGVWIGPK